MKEIFISIVSYGNEEATAYTVSYVGEDREEAIYQAKELARGYESCCGSVEADLQSWLYGEHVKTEHILDFAA